MYAQFKKTTNHVAQRDSDDEAGLVDPCSDRQGHTDGKAANRSINQANEVSRRRTRRGRNAIVKSSGYGDRRFAVIVLVREPWASVGVRRRGD